MSQPSGAVSDLKDTLLHDKTLHRVILACIGIVSAILIVTGIISLTTGAVYVSGSTTGFTEKDTTVFLLSIAIQISKLIGSENVLLPMHDAILIQCTELEADFQRKAVSKLMKDAFVRWCPGVRPQVSIGAYASE